MIRGRSPIRRRHKNSRRGQIARSCTSHLQWVRQCHACLVDDDTCAGPIETAHVDHAGGKGMGLKVRDWASVPLCAAHHVELHGGAETFEAAHGLDLVAIAETLAERSPHRRKFEERLQAGVGR